MEATEFKDVFALLFGEKNNPASTLAMRIETVEVCPQSPFSTVFSDRVNFTAFYEALLNAKGIDLGAGGAGVDKGIRIAESV